MLWLENFLVSELKNGFFFKNMFEEFDTIRNTCDGKCVLECVCVCVCACVCVCHKTFGSLN